jgi:uncharacterized membrane protein HdeD (DUF308 family)
MTATVVSSERSLIPWWLVLLEGIAAVIIGILLLVSPAQTILVLVQVLGFYWLISGILSLVGIFVDSSMWGWKLVVGILGFIAGLIVIQHPLWSAILVPTTLVLILGIEGIIIGVVRLIQAFMGAGWGAGILGILSILFGLILVVNPLLGALSLPLVLGTLGIILGIVAIVMAFRIREPSTA